MATDEQIPPQYDPKAVEKRLYDFWLKIGAFDAPTTSTKEKYCIVVPPPNVTGVLHMGHALTFTLEDILIRRKRMQGFNTLFLPGTDHAGIATQMVVERHLAKEEKLSRHDLGREKFLERVWKWKEQSQDTILNQLKLMGCSLDWSRLRFTLDEGLSHAVRVCFKRLYDDGLIYREEAIIQWCPRCQTALSDLEVKFKETKGKLWHIRYYLKGSKTQWLTVATTRPETLLGDTAVAVHPEDERYRAFHGKAVIVPLVNREVPVIQDAYVDKEFGTGALKITPGHDPNDFIVGKRHGLATLVVMDERARLTVDGYQGLTREKAREKVLGDLQGQGLLEKETDHVHNVGHCDRCTTLVEPRLSPQWFVNAAELAKEALRVVEEKEIRIIPEEWEKTYFEWMRNIRPWCISRQLWWGHRIPVWYCGCGKIFVDIKPPEKCFDCGSSELRQDEDVLDTWFSSGLWPFSTLGWPNEKDPDFKAFYPTDVLETGFDILFFWVARMIMLGLRMTGKVPFHTVYLHPMVRDEYGQKMSKTKGNVKDPLDIMERMGADSLRFTLAAMAVQGRDVLLSDSRVEGYRNFVNKIWNASRFVLMHFPDVKKSNVNAKNDINDWIRFRLNKVKEEVNTSLDHFRFFEAANAIYHFFWHDYCDWFLELIKNSDLDERKAKKESTAIEILDESLRLLHPFMPFVTEEIWLRLPLRATGESISLSKYPEATNQEPPKTPLLKRPIDIVEAIRTMRGESNLPPNAEIGVILSASEWVMKELEPFKELIRKMVKVNTISFEKDYKLFLKSHVLIPLVDVEVLVLREGLLDKEVELSKAEKELASLQAELARAEKKLLSKEFCEKAPNEVVEGVRERSEVLKNQISHLNKYLKELKT